MDSLIIAAARALAAGDPLGALKRVALRDDAPALALRGLAMAQLGDLPRAKALLKSAARAFGPHGAAARLIAGGKERLLVLEDVEALLASSALVVDACRLVVRQGNTIVSLATRPVLFALARVLGEAGPGDATRTDLIARAFGSQFTDE